MQSRVSNAMSKLKTKFKKIYYLYGETINDEDKITPVYYAIYHDESLDLIKELIKHDRSFISSPDVHGISPLMLAIVKHCDFSLIKLLIEEGANLNQIDSLNGFHAMHFAIYNLITDYNNKMKNENNETLKIYKNSLKIVKLLDEKNPDLINKASKEGIVPAQLINPYTFPDITHDIFSNYVIVNH